MSYIITALTGFTASVVGHAIITSMFDPVRDRRMDYLARYACGVSGLFLPIKWQYEELSGQKLDRHYTMAYFMTALLFGLAVLGGGVFRKLRGE